MIDAGSLTPSRRQALSLGIGAASAALLSESIVPAYAANNAYELIRQFTGGKWPTRGRIRIDLPEIAENGNAVRIGISVESPMTEKAHVTDVLVVADGNSQGGIATFQFSPASGIAEVITCIRLSSMQSVIAVAKTNEGDLYMNSKHVRVAIGGCGC
jgi:sulfur-oxidizing protein SoxY